MPSLHIPADPTTQNHAEALAKVVFAARRWTLLTNLGGTVEAEDRDDAWDAYQEAIDAARARNQISIWDVEKGEEVNTGGTGE